MRVLLIGSGGRESALAWALASSDGVEVISAPGNPGMAELGQVANVEPTDPKDVLELARRFDADLVVVGPEAPLVAGVSDALRGAGFPVFGPSAAAARIEGSKAFAKELMTAAGVPTGAARSFTVPGDAVAYLDELGAPYVIKADGLAAGKGVVVTEDRAEAVAAIEDRLVRGAFGDAGSRVLIEEYLPGQEASLIAFVDGSVCVPCEPAQDYKRVFDEDEGPNTGGMGSYSPVPACPPDVADEIVESVLQPVVDELARRETPFVGALYAGLALTSEGPKVIEFNARFGDPETQALMPRLDSNLADLCMAAATGGFGDGWSITWTTQACVAVVLASDGYPGSYSTGVEISGLDEASALEDVAVFHAGTAREGDRIVTAGGRVLAVSALGEDVGEARRRAYEAAASIDFEGKHLRTDIGARAASEPAPADPGSGEGSDDEGSNDG